MKRKRIRKLDTYTGTTLESWQADLENVRWAQNEPRFRMACSVVLHEAARMLVTCAGCSEGRAFGRSEGYNEALAVLRSLAMRPSKATEPLEETFERPSGLVASDVRD